MTREHTLFGLGHNRLVTLPSEFETVGTITTTGTTLAVGGRGWSSLSSYFSGTQSQYIGYTVPKTWNAVELRFQGVVNNTADVVSIWGARGHDHFTRLAVLTLTTGLQVGDDSKLFIDTIVASNEALPKVGAVCDSGNDRICRYVVDLAGYSKLLFLATTLNSASLKIEAGGY